MWTRLAVLKASPSERVKYLSKGVHKLKLCPYFIDWDESIIHKHSGNYNKETMF